jgi:hypothetical protein
VAKSPKLPKAGETAAPPLRINDFRLPGLLPRAASLAQTLVQPDVTLEDLLGKFCRVSTLIRLPKKNEMVPLLSKALANGSHLAGGFMHYHYHQWIEMLRRRLPLDHDVDGVHVRNARCHRL